MQRLEAVLLLLHNKLKDRAMYVDLYLLSPIIC